jgi:hypothetical protein
MCDGAKPTGISEEGIKYVEGIGEFYNCPIHCIPDSVYSFLDTYDILEKYPNSSPPIGEFNPRYLESLKVYESNIKRMSAPQEKPQKELHKSNISKMKKLM